MSGEYFLINNNLKFIDIKRRSICILFLFKEFIAHKIKFKRSFLNYQKKDIYRELKIANISSEDKVLFIGAGLLPLTPILIAEETNNRKITSIDNNLLVTKLTKPYLNKMGLSDKIKLEYGDGQNYPVEDFDVVIMAANVWPLRKILKHLSRNMKKGTKLVCREIKNDISYLIEEDSLCGFFSVESLSEHQHGPAYKSILLKKK